MGLTVGTAAAQERVNSSEKPNQTINTLILYNYYYINNHSSINSQLLIIGANNIIIASN